MRRRTIGAIAVAASLPVLGLAPTVGSAATPSCPHGFTLITAKNARQKAHDQNGDGLVCRKRNPGPGRNAVIDDIIR